MLLNGNIKNKTVLEIASGRGGTTRVLAKELAVNPHNKLIVTDIEDFHFHTIESELKHLNLDLEFMKTDACTLNAVPDESIDILICNYGLCSINSKSGEAFNALLRFKEVLKPGGEIIISDEPPIFNVSTPAQEVWRDKWNILRMCNSKNNLYNFKEISPETLEMFLSKIGFNDISYSYSSTFFKGIDSLDFFQKRLDKALLSINDDAFKNYILSEKDALMKKIASVGGMESPNYTLKARKE